MLIRRSSLGLLKKSLYGTRDAPANWEATILRVMNLLGRRIRTRTFQQLPLLPPSSRHQSGGPRRRLHWTWSQRSAGVVFHRSWQALDGGKAWLFGSTGNARDQAEHRHPEQTCDMDLSEASSWKRTLAMLNSSSAKWDAKEPK